MYGIDETEWFPARSRMLIIIVGFSRSIIRVLQSHLKKKSISTPLFILNVIRPCFISFFFTLGSHIIVLFENGEAYPLSFQNV